MKEYYRVKALIDLDAIFHNIENTRKIIKEGTGIMAVIKTDGYGHGAVPIAKTIDDQVEAYGIAIVQEGIELRKAGIKKPLLILGYTPRQYYRDVIAYHISQTVFGYEMAKILSDTAADMNMTVKVHIKVDTGMSRIGFLPNAASVEEIQKIATLPYLEIEGIFTHFAKADEADKTAAKQQLDTFLRFVADLEEKGIHIPVRHASNSAAMMDMPEANLDMIRSGISTYGLYPSEEVNKSVLPLEPAMSLQSYVIYVKELEAGVGIGYGGTFVTDKKTKVATIPVGYGDGYPRALSNCGRVLIHGKSAPIIGRVCMDQFMVDVSDIEAVKEGDLVTLIGVDGTQRITVEEMADLAGSFNYEFVCDIGKRVPREFYRNGKKVGTLDYFDCMENTLDFQGE